MLLFFGALFAILTSSSTGGNRVPPGEALTAHEWGTFTSVAGENGTSVQWVPLSSAPDLPCFVNRLSPQQLKLAPGLVRMETPVLYFYAPRSMPVSVHVGFPQGWITEWYPQASRVSPDARKAQFTPSFARGRIDWNALQVSPGEEFAFPATGGPSRYFAARETDSAPLQIGHQKEKFIFYRGIANFNVPIQPTFGNDGKIEIRNTGRDAIPLIILVENREGNLGYRIAHSVRDSVRLDPPQLTANFDDLRQDIAGTLTEFGLYQKEARAMIETWHDSWFEEGTRVFYIVPRTFVDSQLPMRIDPSPAELVRVFVGRVELLSPWTQQTIETALSDGDLRTLAKFGRFLDPFIDQIRQKNSSLVQSRAAEEYLEKANIEIQREFNAPTCVQ